MNKFNPIKTIMDIEKEEGKFIELGPLEGIGAAVTYIFIVTIIMTLFSSFEWKNTAALSITRTIGVVISFYVILKIVANNQISYSHKNTRNKKVAKKFNIKNISIITIAFFGLTLFFAAAMMPLLKDLQGYDMIKSFSKMMAKTPLFLIAYEIVLGPTMEEIVFRGVILNGLITKGYSKSFAILYSAFIFGAVHLNLCQFVIALMVGIFLGYIYVKTHSILLCCFVHILNNAISVIIFLFIPKVLTIMSGNILTVITLSLAGLLLMFWALKNITNSEEVIKLKNI